MPSGCGIGFSDKIDFGLHAALVSGRDILCTVHGIGAIIEVKTRALGLEVGGLQTSGLISHHHHHHCIVRLAPIQCVDPLTITSTSSVMFPAWWHDGIFHAEVVK